MLLVLVSYRIKSSFLALLLARWNIAVVSQNNLFASSSEAELFVARASALSLVSPGQGWRKSVALWAVVLVVSGDSTVFTSLVASKGLSNFQGLVLMDFQMRSQPDPQR